MLRSDMVTPQYVPYVEGDMPAINFYYVEKDGVVNTGSVKVNYYKNGTEDPLASSQMYVGEANTFMDVYALNMLGIGWVLRSDMVSPQMVVFDEGVDKVINFFYVMADDGIGPGDDDWYLVTYNGNGHTSGTAPVDRNSPYLSGSLVTVLGQGDLVRNGYTFLGWSLSSTAGTAPFVVGSTFTILVDTVLYAVWEQNNTTSVTYTVIYRPGAHGTFSAKTVSGLLYGDPTPEAPVVTGETGWNFTGWTPTPTTTITGNATYTAQWEQEQTTGPDTMFTVRFVDWNGTLLKTQQVRYGDSATAPSDPSREGYTFAGWDCEFTNIQSDLTVTAQYKQIVTSPSPPPPTTTPPPGEITSTWAFANLMLGVAGLLLAIIVVIWVLLQTKQQQKKEAEQLGNINQNAAQHRNNQNYESKQKQHRLIWLITAVALGIAGILIFLLTEDMSRPMGAVDTWTIVNTIIFIVELIAITFIFKHTKKDGNIND
jgi:uncharacterized repeat protein (TIGR02543 family)